MSIGNNFDSNNIEIIDLLNQIKYKLWAEMTVKDMTWSQVRDDSKMYTIGGNYTYIYKLDSDGFSIGAVAPGFMPGLNQRRVQHSSAKMRFHGKTIIVTAGGVENNFTHNGHGLRSVEILDISSPDPRWKYGNK